MFCLCYQRHFTSSPTTRLPIHPSLLEHFHEIQVEKLRMLSVVSLAHASKVVPYATMKEALGMDNVRHLEDLIFDTMYSGLLQGKLDQRQEVLKVGRPGHRPCF